MSEVSVIENVNIKGVQMSLVYCARFARQVRLIKRLSASTLGLAILASPFPFLIKTTALIKPVAKVGILATLMGSSATSTWLLSILTRSYVTRVFVPSKTKVITKDTNVTFETCNVFGSHIYTKTLVSAIENYEKPFCTWKINGPKEVRLFLDVPRIHSNEYKAKLNKNLLMHQLVDIVSPISYQLNK